MRKTIAALLLCGSASPAAAYCPQHLSYDTWSTCREQERAISRQQIEIEETNRQMNDLRMQQERMRREIERERVTRDRRSHPLDLR